MYDNWLFLTLFLFPPKIVGEERKNEVAKPVLTQFKDPIDFHRKADYFTLENPLIDIPYKSVKG